MKRTAFALLLVAASLSIGSAQALFFAGSSPELSLNNWTPVPRETADWRFFQTNDLSEWYRRYLAFPSPAFFGLDLRWEGMAVFLKLDLRGDFRSFITTPNHVNLPFLEDGLSPILDVNFPNIGYAEWRGEEFSLSLGRRKIAWGPGTWSLALSDSAPYYDHLELDWERRVEGGGAWRYSFLVISADRAAAADPVLDGPSWRVRPTQKTIAAHRLVWEGDRLRLGLGELNLIYGVSPDLQDLSPFGIYHNTYQDANANVMLEASAESRLGPLRAYGEFVLDDFVMPKEDPRYRPAAMGWLFGAEAELLRGRPLGGEAEAAYARDSLRALREPTFARPGGLKLRFEHYRASTYLYNREKAEGKFTYPDLRFTVAQYASGIEPRYAYVPAAFYLGFPYGPDAVLDLIQATWEDDPLRASLRLEYLRKGSYGILSPYGPDDNLYAWLAFAAPVSSSLRASLDAELRLADWLRVSAGASLAVGDALEWELRLGATLSSRIPRSGDAESFRP
jgi:hypothetical protein